MSVNNLLTHYNNKIPTDILKLSDAIVSTLARKKKYKHCVKGVIILIYIERMKLK